MNNKDKIKVSDEIYSAICYMSYKVKRAKQKDAEHEIIHYYAFDTEDSDGENLVRDPSPLPDEIVIKNDIYDALYDALATLSIEDQLLLFNIFVKRESLRSIATRENTNAMAISRHRDKLFKKLAKLLIKYKIND